MRTPYFPMYPADFEAKTSHLTLEEDGAYNRLLRLCWMTPGCSLPDDAAWIARRMRVSVADFERVVKPLLDEFFKREKGRVFSPRLTEEWEKVDETYRKRSEAGKKGGRPKAVENKQKDEKAGFGFDKAGPKQPEPEPEPDLSKKEEPASAGSKKSQAKGTRLPEEWTLPSDLRQWAADQGLSQAIIDREAATFADYWHARPGREAVKLDWAATWRNWCRKALERAPPQVGRKPHDTAAAFARAFPDLNMDTPQ